MFKDRLYVNIIICYLALCGLFAHVWVPINMMSNTSNSAIYGGMIGVLGAIVTRSFQLLESLIAMFGTTLDKIIALDSNSTIGALIIGIVLTEVVRWVFSKRGKK
jgi:hypothetical protein